MLYSGRPTKRFRVTYLLRASCRPPLACARLLFALSPPSPRRLSDKVQNQSVEKWEICVALKSPIQDITSAAPVRVSSELATDLEFEFGLCESCCSPACCGIAQLQSQVLPSSSLSHRPSVRPTLFVRRRSPACAHGAVPLRGSTLDPRRRQAVLDLAPERV